MIVERNYLNIFFLFFLMTHTIIIPKKKDINDIGALGNDQFEFVIDHQEARLTAAFHGKKKETKATRIIRDGYGRPYFVGKYAAGMFLYNKTRKAVKNHVSSYNKMTYGEFHKIWRQGQKKLLQDSQQVISEGGLYELAISSHFLKKALGDNVFKKWVTNELLPKLRKKEMDMLKKYQQQINLLKDIVKEKDDKIDSLQATIESLQEGQ